MDKPCAPAPAEPGPCLALLTDFGLDDPYVGQMKAVLSTLVPTARILDLTHGVPAFQVETGAFFLAASYGYYPPGTLFLAVIDPGVGGRRDILCLQDGRYTFLAPDNGLLSLTTIRQRAAGETPRLWRLYPPLISEAALPASGATFAGRDIFSPLAASLLRGTTPAGLGEEVPLENLVIPLWAAPERKGNQLLGTVLHVDCFGNAILNLPAAEWKTALQGRELWLVMSSAGAEAALPITSAETYAQLLPGKVGLIAGSQGFLELALNQASAAAELNLKPGDLLRLGIG